MVSSHNRGSRQYAEFRQLENEVHSSARRVILRRSLDLIRILEAYRSIEEETIIVRQLVLMRQGPGESIVKYINRWLEIARKCKNPPPRNLWITLCLHSLHHDFRILAI